MWRRCGIETAGASCDRRRSPRAPVRVKRRSAFRPQAPRRRRFGHGRSACRPTDPRVRRQPVRLAGLRPIRPEHRQDRAPARRRRQRQRQPCHHEGSRGCLRAGPPGAGDPVRTGQARPAGHARRRRRRHPGRRLQGTLFPGEETRRPAFEQIATRKRGAVRARNLAQDAYLQRAARATNSSSPKVRPAPARPGSRSATRSRCWNGAPSSA